jgi:putative tricarboxylic transport membrane protein
MKLNDAVFGLLFAALGALVLFAVQGFPKIPGQPVGPALFPGLIAIGLCVTGIVLMVRGWRERASQPWLQWDDWVHSPRHIAAFALLVAGIVLYIAGSNVIGFIPCAIAILMALFLVLRVPIGRSVVIAVIATLVVHFAFYKLLRVPLPWGLLTPIAW